MNDHIIIICSFYWNMRTEPEELTHAHHVLVMSAQGVDECMINVHYYYYILSVITIASSTYTYNSNILLPATKLEKELIRCVKLCLNTNSRGQTESARKWVNTETSCDLTPPPPKKKKTMTVATLGLLTYVSYTDSVTEFSSAVRVPGSGQVVPQTCLTLSRKRYWRGPRPQGVGGSASVSLWPA